MSSFTLLSEMQSVREQNLKEVARRLSYEEAAAMPSFETPIKLFELWQNMPGDIPHYSNLKASMLGPEALPFIYILDVMTENDPENDTGDVDFRFRLFGTGITSNYGKEATGFRLSQSAQKGADLGVASGLGIIQQSYHARYPRFMLCEYFKNDEIVKYASFIVLPLSDDDGELSRMFGCGMWTTP